MRKDTTSTIKRAERFQIILIGEGILVGGIGGLVVLLYRMCLEYAGKWLNMILEYARQSPVRIAAWFLILIAMAWLVGKLVNYEPMISGSGIPQLEGEMAGKLEQKWWKVLPAKFVGGFLCLLGGLALGREGPSIQLGAMVGKGISRGMDRGKT
ncbi:chloride channel protein, partial [[Clostridium] scindens]